MGAEDFIEFNNDSYIRGLDCNENNVSFNLSARWLKDMYEMNIKELLANLMNSIDEALINNNEIIFNKLSKQYKYLSVEM